MKHVFVLLLALLIASCQNSNAGGPSVTLKTEIDTLSYSFGAQMGSNLAFAGDTLNVDALLEGLRSALLKQDLKLTDDQILAGFNDCNQLLRGKFMEEQTRLAQENVQKGESFLAENKTKEGVMETPSGLQYKVLSEGNGVAPTASDKVKVHYRGTLLDGKEFDSSYKRGEPATFGLDGVIPGWTEGIQLMKPGAKYEFYVPSSLAYGERGFPPNIPPNSTLIFEVELLEVVK